jgi:beta-phosphoglucomutase
MSNNIQAIVWDLDGVILDSAEEHRRAWKRLAEDEGIIFTDEDFWQTFGKRNDDIIPHYWRTTSASQVQELANRKEEYFRDFVRETATFLPGAEELMREIHEAGLAQALASSTPVENIRLIKELLGLGRYLTAFVSGEMVEHGKPAPDVFLLAAQELGIPAHACVVIEDAVAGIEAARRAGMYSIAVAYGRVLPGLKAATLVVDALTEVNVAGVCNLAHGK